ncbi:hypothetical protein [Chroococcidiopsis sp. CCMEE 29]|uniref:hypothetical protein n=1 Tax=Chroococcidiopsis sp. CCMEE 29 TaxID=155894 RepID=UPI00202045A1|nr:hypothetical protein [Chroococcidiopsis sp. CCMEE 29]
MRCKILVLRQSWSAAAQPERYAAHVICRGVTKNLSISIKSQLRKLASTHMHYF